MIPKVLENWDDFSEVRKSQLGKMGNFLCTLHLLGNFASETDKVFHNFESVLLSDNDEPMNLCFLSTQSNLVLHN